MTDEAYAAALKALFARTNQGIKLGLEPMRAALGALGHPERAARHVIVAGTNGKGSTSLLLALALSAAGHRVGHYTSPHLLRFTERIRVDGRELARSEVPRLLDLVLRAEGACERPLTFFELVTAMALVAFAEAGVELAVLEVGMGGRLDATNVVDKLLAVITPVDFDHMHFLGDTLAKIAFEKAGVISEHGIVVHGRQKPEALEVIERVAAERDARVVPAAGVLRERARLLVAVTPPLPLAAWPPGAYQRDNVATAVTALRELASLGVSCPDDAIARAAASFRWPGRYDWLDGRVPTLLDGAHNPAGIQALLAALAEDPRARGRPLHVVATVLRDRPPAEMLPPLAARAKTLHLSPVASARSRTTSELAALWPAARAHADLGSALSAAESAAGADGGVVVACGSLFLVGEALAILKGEAKDPAVDG